MRLAAATLSRPSRPCCHRAGGGASSRTAGHRAGLAPRSPWPPPTRRRPCCFPRSSPGRSSLGPSLAAAVWARLPSRWHFGASARAAAAS
eukprot:1881631-Pyramimonas_sp.AAC.1